MSTKLIESQTIDSIIHSFRNYNLRDIKEINSNVLDFTIAEFILCSCFIDQLSGFRYNKNGVKSRYVKFVKEYLRLYNAEELYEDLRNKLVHNYSVGKYYQLTRKTPHLHLQRINGVNVLNLESFIKDIDKAFELYVTELHSDNSIRNNALEWYAKHKIITLVL